MHNTSSHAGSLVSLFTGNPSSQLPAVLIEASMRLHIQLERAMIYQIPGLKEN